MRFSCSSPPRVDGVPDWLQTTTATPAVSATNQPSQNAGAEDPGAGGLDWLQSLARPTATAVGGVLAPPHDDSISSPTREQPPGRAPGKTAAEEVGVVDWLGDALKGTIPSTPIKRTPGTETSPTQEEDGPENSAVGDDWLSIAKSGGQIKRKSPPSPAARHSVAATQGGWMSSGRLGLPAGDSSDEGDVGTTGGGGGSTAAAPAKPKKHKKQAGRSSPTAGGPAGWLGSGALGVPAEDGSDEDDGGGGGGGSDDGRGVGVTIETQTEDDIHAVTEKGTVEKEDAPKLPPWAKPWVPPPKPEVAPETAPEVASAPGGGTEKEVI